MAVVDGFNSNNNIFFHKNDLVTYNMVAD